MTHSVQIRSDVNVIDQEQYAPVLVTVYNRLEHFRKCIESLSDCYGASRTTLFVAIDAPSRDCDVDLNLQIVDYAKRIRGFESVILIEREANVGAVRNYFMALDRVFQEHSSVIFTEDDNVFSRHFLEYINKGLVLYENVASIYGICGYSRPGLIESDEIPDVFLSRDCPAWGVGIWKSKFRAVDYKTNDFFTAFLNPIRILSFRRQWGDHFFWSLVRAKRENVVICDAAVGFHKFQRDMYSILPTKTLVRNIGQDGSGIHSGVNEVLQNQEMRDGEKKVKFPEVLVFPNNIDEARTKQLRFTVRGNLKCVVQFYWLALKRIVIRR